MDIETNEARTPLDDTVVGESGPQRFIAACRVDRMRRGFSNPRKHFDEGQLNELAADISANGIIEPLVVRELGDGWFEVVCGERRWRAAQRAGLAAVPVIVRVLTDRQVLECQLSENGQRADVHPLEEADGFKALHDQHGVPVEEIAAHIGMNVAFVRRRLQLATLPEEARTAMFAGKLSVGVAQLVARMPPTHQVKALETLLKPNPSWQNPDGVWTERAAHEWIRQHFHLRIAQAPFDPGDGGLLPGAGPCTVCPKNTATQRELFDELREREGECTDPDCYGQKREATWARETAAQREAGKKVLTVTESEQALRAYGPKAYVRLNEKPYDQNINPGAKKTWAQLLKGHLPETVVVRDYSGAPVELVDPESLKAAKKAAGLTGKKDPDREGRSKPTKGKRPTIGSAEWQAEEKLNNALDARVVSAMGQAAQNYQLTTGNERAFWQWLTISLGHLIGTDILGDVLRRRDPKRKVGYGDEENLWADEASVLTPAGCRSMLAEAVTLALLESGDESPAFEKCVAFFKIDVDAIEKKLRDELAAEAETQKPAKAAKGKPTAKAPAKPTSTPKKPAAKKPVKKARA